MRLGKLLPVYRIIWSVCCQLTSLLPPTTSVSVQSLAKLPPKPLHHLILSPNSTSRAFPICCRRPLSSISCMLSKDISAVSNLLCLLPIPRQTASEQFHHVILSPIRLRVHFEPFGVALFAAVLFLSSSRNQSIWALQGRSISLPLPVHSHETVSQRAESVSPSLRAPFVQKGTCFSARTLFSENVGNFENESLENAYPCTRFSIDHWSDECRLLYTVMKLQLFECMIVNFLMMWLV